MDLKYFARTLRTVRHLRFSQLVWRMRYRWQMGRPAAAGRVADPVTLRGDFPGVPEVFHCPGTAGEELLMQLERGEFEHLGMCRKLGNRPTDWRLQQTAEDRLWTVTLHYHAWAWELAKLIRGGGPLRGRAARVLRDYLADWMASCDLSAPGARNLAWNAYAIATRISWWCRVYRAIGEAGRQDWGALESTFLESLWRQAAYLYRHVEWDLRGNHLLRDAVGLAWAGRFFAGREAQRWLAHATRLANEQLAEQVLPDGGHFERSTMYHVQAMEDVLALAFLVEDERVRTRLREKWLEMAEFLAWVRHPDGQIPLLNDGGLNGACEPRQMLELGSESLGQRMDLSPRVGSKHFGDFGLAVWQGDPWTVFFDVGQVGPDYQPGHAHADTLSFEASYGGHRLVVDPGTYCYDNDERRRYDRSTLSHNTVCVDGIDSTEVWHIFRVGRRASIDDCQIDARGDGLAVRASHSGFLHLDGCPRHTRMLEVDGRGTLRIVDRIEGTGRHRIEGGLLISPEWEIANTPHGLKLCRGELALRLDLEGGQMMVDVQQRPYHPEYGRELTAGRVRWHNVLQLPSIITLRIEPWVPTEG